MTITAEIKPLPVEAMSKDDVLFRELEIKMQRLGHLTPFRESLNWQRSIGTYEIGSEDLINKLKKVAAKNDGVPLFYAKMFKKTVYQQLILHPQNQGFYLPFRFEEPFTIDIQGKRVWIGSTVRLAEELKWLEITMESEPSEELVELWKTLRDMCEQSLEEMSAVTIESA
jgi:hypothetical protein